MKVTGDIKKKNLFLDPLEETLSHRTSPSSQQEIIFVQWLDFIVSLLSAAELSFAFQHFLQSSKPNTTHVVKAVISGVGETSVACEEMLSGRFVPFYSANLHLRHILKDFQFRAGSPFMPLFYSWLVKDSRWTPGDIIIRVLYSFSGTILWKAFPVMFPNDSRFHGGRRSSLEHKHSYLRLFQFCMRTYSECWQVLVALVDRQSTVLVSVIGLFKQTKMLWLVRQAVGDICHFLDSVVVRNKSSVLW